MMILLLRFFMADLYLSSPQKLVISRACSSDNRVGRKEAQNAIIGWESYTHMKFKRTFMNMSFGHSVEMGVLSCVKRCITLF